MSSIHFWFWRYQRTVFSIPSSNCRLGCQPSSSLSHINDRGTETEFHVIGKNDGVAYLVNDDNFDRTVEIKGIEPNDEGVQMQ